MAETYNTELAIQAQKKYCNDKGYPHFAPRNGVCFDCNKNIYQQIKREKYTTGITVEKAGSSLITGCPHCHRTYCD